MGGGRIGYLYEKELGDVMKGGRVLKLSYQQTGACETFRRTRAMEGVGVKIERWPRQVVRPCLSMRKGRGDEKGT